STSDATDRIASIMRKGLQPGQVNPSTPLSNAKLSALAEPAPRTGKLAPDATAASAPQGVAAMFETAPSPPPQAPGKVAGQIIEWLKSEISSDPDLNHVTVLTIIGALAGYAAQRAIWEGVMVPGGMSATDVFEVRQSGSGEKFYFCAEADK